MPEPTREGHDAAEGRRGLRIELASAVLLAVATVGAAWAGYQTARWGGVQATELANANGARLESTRAATRGGQLAQVDVASFFEVADAFAAGDRELFDFYVKRLRPEFRPIFEAWLALDPVNNPDAPLSPFALPEYKVAELVRAERLGADAERATDAARTANGTANNYALSLVLFATALFFAGISTKFRADRARIGLLAVGLVLFVGVAIWIGTLPKSVAL